MQWHKKVFGVFQVGRGMKYFNKCLTDVEWWRKWGNDDLWSTGKQTINNILKDLLLGLAKGANQLCYKSTWSMKEKKNISYFIFMFDCKKMTNVR